MKTPASTAALVLLLNPSIAIAGAYLYSTNLGPVPPAYDEFIINHSSGYTGAAGVIQLGICLDGASQALQGSLEWAIKTWNERRPMKNNCEGPQEACLRADANDCVAPTCTCGQIPFPADTYPCLPWVFNAGSILVHELGHCALGLGHNNWVANGRTSFTTTKLATSMNAGGDQVRGSKDDTPVPNPGSKILHWFRTSDNDPFILDTATPMNTDTFSRNRFLLPVGSSWPTSANVKVAGPLVLNAGRTQSNMVSIAGPNTDYVGLVGDEVNTVRFAFSGLDNAPGATSDDYSVQLSLEPSCATAAIKVQFVDFAPPLPANAVGYCQAELAPIPIPGQAVSHYRLVPEAGQPLIVVSLDFPLPQDMSWRFVIMLDGFETGNASWWSLVAP